MRLAIVDTETTGVGPDAKLLEVGVLLVEDSEITVTYTETQDPHEALSEETFELTGLTDADVQGHQIEWGHVQAIVRQADMCVAFNAQFDRRFLDPHMRHDRWACAFKMVDWTGYHRMRHASLEFLALRHGLPVQSHRALDDCRTTWALLQQQDPCERRRGTTYLHEMLEAAQAPWGIVYLDSTPRGANEGLKALGFRWFPETKRWWRELRKDRLPEMASQLDAIGCTQRRFGSADITSPTAADTILRKTIAD